MQSHSVEKVSEVGDAYWRHRVVTLEILVAELLVKNQNMRFNLQAVEQQRSTAEGAGIEMVHNQRVSSPQS
jgi:hypothetical protein